MRTTDECESCGADVSTGEDEWSFCPFCGAPLDAFDWSEEINEHLDGYGDEPIGIAQNDAGPGEIVEIRLL